MPQFPAKIFKYITKRLSEPQAENRNKIHVSGQKAKIAVNMQPKIAPWGGGNQFVTQLVQYLRGNGHEVVFDLEPDLTSILLVEPRPIEAVKFNVDDIKKYKNRFPHVRCVHRVNECDKRKDTNSMDSLLQKANNVADNTVFISSWLKDYFIDSWFDKTKPHLVIENGADSKIFHPHGGESWSIGDDFKVVTHHWSNNWMKGFRVYQEVDQMIGRGELPGFSLMVIGRWPQEIDWRSAVTHPPAHGVALADLLRRNHAYLTASLWEPCGMHHIEGAQCGLPLVYHEDGGGIVEFGQRYGVGFQQDIKGALLKARNNYHDLHEAVRRLPPSGEKMCRLYEEVLV